MKQYADMSNPHKVKGAEALLLSLLAEGTDTLFGYPGGAIIPVYDPLYGYTDGNLEEVFSGNYTLHANVFSIGVGFSF